MSAAPSLWAGLRAKLQARVGALSIDVDLDTGGGTLVMVGPNGSGKTSLLSLLLGVLPCRRGRIEVENAVLFDSDTGVDVAVEERRLGYLPQDYALFPHLSVRENIAFAVRSASGSSTSSARDEKIERALRDLGISALADRRTQTLSGGEKQRVALARALSIEPRALLLDEPLAALDVASRSEVRAFLTETLARLAIPSIVVTHDAADARALGQRVLVLEGGRATQVGSWDELVERPATRFVEALVDALVAAPGHATSDARSTSARS